MKSRGFIISSGIPKGKQTVRIKFGIFHLMKLVWTLCFREEFSPGINKDLPRGKGRIYFVLPRKKLHYQNMALFNTK